MLAEQLARASRKEEALAQLEILYDNLMEQGRTTESAATLERMNAIDPAFKPRRSPVSRKRQKEGLVFLDLDFDDAVPTPRGVPSPAPVDEDPSPTVRQPQTLADRFTEASPDPDAHAPANELRFITPVTPPAPEAPAEPEQHESEHPEPEPQEPEPVGEIPHIELAPLVEIPEPREEEPREEEPREEEPREEEPLELPGNGYYESPAATTPDDEFIDLGEWLERNRTPASTRMVVHDEEPEDEEQKDFAEMLEKFKAGISRNVDDEDFESHYDLGIAFREMGLLDEAIGSFQKALRGAGQRVRAAEAIGQCFMDKGEAGVTITVLERLVRDTDMSDADLVGVLYLLGRAAESLGRYEAASGYFQRVLAVQIGFRDTASRLSALAG